MENKPTTSRKWRAKVYRLIPIENNARTVEFTRIIDHRDEHIIYHQEIEFLEASGSYTIIHRKTKGSLVVCQNIGKVIEKLNPYLFFRIDRSVAINVRELAEYIDGRCGQVTLYNGSKYKVAARRRSEFLLYLNTFANANNFELDARLTKH
jgi:DNA-binding LytR/AlgR family response regulator